MPRMSEIGDAFLDGFGSLGAIFEPAIRPGSQDNLIQQPTESLPLSSVRRSLLAKAVSATIDAMLMLERRLGASDRRSKLRSDAGDEAHHGA